MENFKIKVRDFWWAIRCRCRFCGGRTWYWDYKKEICYDCERNQKHEAK